jgi:hypothetical protein
VLRRNLEMVIENPTGFGLVWKCTGIVC